VKKGGAADAGPGIGQNIVGQFAIMKKSVKYFLLS